MSASACRWASWLPMSAQPIAFLVAFPIPPSDGDAGRLAALWTKPGIIDAAVIGDAAQSAIPVSICSRLTPDLRHPSTAWAIFDTTSPGTGDGHESEYDLAMMCACAECAVPLR